MSVIAVQIDFSYDLWIHHWIWLQGTGCFRPGDLHLQHAEHLCTHKDDVLLKGHCKLAHPLPRLAYFALFSHTLRDTCIA